MFQGMHTSFAAHAPHPPSSLPPFFAAAQNFELISVDAEKNVSYSSRLQLGILGEERCFLLA